MPTSHALRRSSKNKGTEQKVGVRLERFRLDRALTYDRLADLVGVSTPTIFKVCAGERVTMLTLAKINNFLRLHSNGGTHVD